ncbi:MAG: hypothetical protein Aurels2KO_16280 [Aureliella sp.]
MNIKAFFGTLLVAFGVFLVWRVVSQSSGTAGTAYVENEAGELVRSDSAEGKAVSRIVASDLSKRDIESLNRIRKQAEEQNLSDEEWARSFDLIERSGKKISSEDLSGQPYVAGFFFSLCPTICVKQNEKVQQLQEIFADRPVRFVSISCDPEIDTPSKLTEYARRFNADQEQWLFLTGDMKQIERVGGEMFNLAVSRRFHAEKFVLVDGEGDIIGFYAWADPVEWQMLQSDIEALLQAGGIFPGKKSSDPS